MDNVYVQSLRIPCYDTDGAQMLKPVSFMNYAQEIANCHASVLGFGYDDLIRTRTAWVLSRMHVRFNRMPLWRDNVKLSTWHKGPEGLFYIRDFRLADADGGEDLVVATTSWVVLNIDTRHFSREVLLDEDSVCRDNALTPSCGKIRIPSGTDMKFVTGHTVSYSDLDLNGHANNAMYLLWAMDAIDRDVTLSTPLKEVKINFNHEVKAGDCVGIHVCGTDVPEGRKFLVEGRTGGQENKSSFLAELLF